MNFVEKKLNKRSNKLVNILFKLLLICFVVTLFSYTLHPVSLVRLVYSPTPDVLLDDGTPLSWIPTSWGTGNLDSPTIQNVTIDGKDGSALLEIQIGNGTSSNAEMLSVLSFNKDWSSMNFLSFYLDNLDSGNLIILIRAPDIENSFFVNVEYNQDTLEHFIYFHDFSVNSGSPSWENVSVISLIFNKMGVWHAGPILIGNDSLYLLHVETQNILTLTIEYLTIAVIIVYPVTLLKKRMKHVKL